MTVGVAVKTPVCGLAERYSKRADPTVVAVSYASTGELTHAAVPMGCLLMVPCCSKTGQFRLPQTDEMIHAEPDLCAVRRLRLPCK